MTQKSQAETEVRSEPKAQQNNSVSIGGSVSGSTVSGGDAQSTTSASKSSSPWWVKGIQAVLSKFT